jgi:hypothetical protein
MTQSVARSVARGSRILRPRLGLALGGSVVWSKGWSNSVNDSVRADNAVCFYLGGFAEVGFQISEIVSIPLSLSVGAVLPGVTVLIDAETPAKFGPLLIEIVLGVRIHLPEP